MEARALEHAFAYCVEPDPAHLACPVKVIGGDPRLEFTLIPSSAVERPRAFGYEFVSETTHFLPLENPTMCANRMMAFLEEQGLLDFAAPGGPGEGRERRRPTARRGYGVVHRLDDRNRVFSPV